MEILWIVVAVLIKIVVILGFAVVLSALLTWMERRYSAMMQDRVGPERACVLPPSAKDGTLGRLRLWGLVHPLADALKLAVKEDFIPPKSHKFLFSIAPLFALAPVLLVFAVIPFGPPLVLDKLAAVVPDAHAFDKMQYLQVAHLDIGFLFIFAIASLSVYGATLAGWSSHNTYGMLGGLRAAAQMISYEVTMGLAVMGAFVVYGTLEPNAVVEAQARGHWGIVSQPLGFLLFFFAAIAETKRSPFDIPEGESEIVGYFVEYSGSRFMMFYLGEFLEIVFCGALVTTLYFGGWHFPYYDVAAASLPHWLVVCLGVAAFGFKVFMLCVLQLTIRWSVPRMRYDQLMTLGWKGMLPASLINVVITAGMVLWDQTATRLP